MVNFKSIKKLFVLLFGSFEVRFELVGSKAQKKEKPFVLLFKSFEVRFEVVTQPPRSPGFARRPGVYGRKRGWELGGCSELSWAQPSRLASLGSLGGRRKMGMFWSQPPRPNGSTNWYRSVIISNTGEIFSNSNN